MKRGFYTIMSAQFFSSLADNALFVAAVELLRTGGAPEWQRRRWCRCSRCSMWSWRPSSALLPMPAQGQGDVHQQRIKVVGCLMMLFGGHPLLAYAMVGLGAAAYSPAKYGILTELLPPRSWSRPMAGSRA
jgi:LPLT family lysophospholipid transporter-like MFS transporter